LIEESEPPKLSQQLPHVGQETRGGGGRSLTPWLELGAGSSVNQQPRWLRYRVAQASSPLGFPLTVPLRALASGNQFLTGLTVNNMKLKTIKLSTLGLLPVTLFILAGCASTPEVDKTTTVAFKEGVPGGTLVQSYETTAKVTAIDPATRMVTLIAPDNSRCTFKAGPKVMLDQIKLNEEVKVAVVRELVVFMNRNDLPAASGATAIARAIPGTKPGVLTAESVDTTAVVTALDLPKYEATLKLSDGRSENFKIRADVDLSKIPLGAEVYIRTSAAVAIREK
jgi:hypothetical protein